MHFRIHHRKTYVYSRPVFLEPHIIRMRPRNDAFQRLLSYGLRVSPEPAGQSDLLDANGNAATQIWFNDETDRLEITVDIEADTLVTNPFNYLLTGATAGRLPMMYGPDMAALWAYREPPTEADEVVRFAAGLAEDVDGKVLDFLNRLNDTIYGMLEQEVREDGPPYPPSQTLETRRGSCRDAAVLFIAACRAVGVAARFVSGYQEGDRDTDMRHLHAWPEVYLPGAGWRGYDPTHGLLVTNGHVALAVAPEADGAMPLTGSFRGTGATWEASFDLEISVTGGEAIAADGTAG